MVEERQPWIDRIREFQMVESLGWTAEDVEYGGWSEALTPPKRPDDAQGVDRPSVANISATLFGLGALKISGFPAKIPPCSRRSLSWSAARTFPETVASFTPPTAISIIRRGAGFLRDRHRRRTPVARACGLAEDHPRGQGRSEWLEKNFDATRVAGAFPEDKERRRESLYYYYCWSVSHALGRYPTDHKTWARELTEELLRRQKPEGHWVNPVPGMTEDEPIVATTFAVSALSLAYPIWRRNHDQVGQATQA